MRFKSRLCDQNRSKSNDSLNAGRRRLSLRLNLLNKLNAGMGRTQHGLHQGMGCEKLETRQLLTGSWTTLATAVPNSDGAENAVVLSDGTIMVHGGSGSASNKWYKLTPTNGNYVNGTWSTLTASPTYRLFDATEVLTNGNVMVLGGEYSGSTTADTFINTGEIYNPVTNAWTVMPNFPQSQFGDDPTEMLPNGNVLTGYISGAQTYIYNPTANTWAATGTKMRNDASDEEAWVKLPDDSILSYDVFASISSKTPSAQRYIPSTGTWVNAGNPPAQLSSAAVGYELGPGLLLPDGRAFYTGATAATAYYTPSTNTWAAGPAFKVGTTSYVSADAPGAVLPNGDVLLAMSPLGKQVSGGYNFPSPTAVFEMNPTTNVVTNVTPSLTGFSMSEPSFIYTFLVLPSGQVMMFGDSGTVAVYTPSGTASAALQPTIANITNNAGTNTFTLSGYQLNGRSEGAGYGDDDEMSSNYPIVQLTSQNGTITYARTFNWTLDGVASANSSVSFTEPAVGTYLVNVIASGIASPTVLDIQAGAAVGENFALQPDSNSANVDVNLGEGGLLYATFPLSSFTSVIMTGDAANNTLVVNANLGSDPTTVNGGSGVNDLVVENNGTGAVSEYGGSGTDTFDFSSYAQNLSNIANVTNVYGGTGNEQVVLHDNNSSTGAVYTVTSTGVTRPGFGGLSIAAAVSGISLTTGTGSDVVNVLSSAVNAPVNLDSAGGSDTVNIGNANNVQGIAAAVAVNNSSGLTTLNILDSADTTAHAGITISANASTGALNGLAPAAIKWSTNQISAIAINGAGGSNTFTISSAGISGTTTINTDAGSDAVVFNGAIAGTFAVNGSGGTSTINVNDNLSTTPQSWLVNAASVSRTGFAVSYSAIASISLSTGPGNDSVDVEAPATAASVNNDGGQDAYVVDAVSMNLSNLSSPLTFNGGTGGATLTLNNSANSAASAVNTTITPVAVNVSSGSIGYAGISTLTYNLANASGAVYIVGTTPTTAYVINTSSNPTELDLGQGNLTSVTSDTTDNLGGITFNASGAGDQLLLDSSASNTPVTYNFAAGTVDIPGQLHVAYTGTLTLLELSAGTGTDTINVNSTATGLPVMIEPSTGGDAVNVDPSGTGTAVAEFTATQQIGALTIGSGGLAIIPTGAIKVLQATSIATFGTGTLDLTTNDLDITNSSLATVSTLVGTGFAGNWLGSGITSSSAANDSTYLTALGVIQNNQSGSAIFTSTNLFDGASVGAGDVLVKYTYYGDTNLDGQVDGSDYSNIDNGILNGLTGWNNGDFNYDTSVDGTDYTLIDNAYNTQGASLAAQIAPAAAAFKSHSISRPADVFSQRQIASPTANSAATWESSPDNIAAGIFASSDDKRNEIGKRFVLEA